MIKSQSEPFRNSPAANEERGTLWCHQLQKRWSRMGTRLGSSLGRLVGGAPSSVSQRIGNAKHCHQPSNRQTAHPRCCHCLPWWQGMTTGWNIPQGQHCWEAPGLLGSCLTEGSKACGNGIHQVERTVGNRNERWAPYHARGAQRNRNHGARPLEHFGENKRVSDKVGRQSRSHPHSIRANRGFDRAAWTWARWKEAPGPAGLGEEGGTKPESNRRQTHRTLREHLTQGKERIALARGSRARQSHPVIRAFGESEDTHGAVLLRLSPGVQVHIPLCDSSEGGSSRLRILAEPFGEKTAIWVVLCKLRPFILMS